MILGTLGGLSSVYALSFEWDQNLYVVDHGGRLTLILDTNPGTGYDEGVNATVGLDDGSPGIIVTLTRDGPIKFSSQFIEFTNSGNGPNQLDVPDEELVSFTAIVSDPVSIPAASTVTNMTVNNGRLLDDDYATKKSKFVVDNDPCVNLGGDDDGDGLCNDWETPNGLVVWIDDPLINYTLPCFTDDYADDPLGLGVCPRPDKADIFIEIDSMIGHTPSETGLLQVVNAFRWSNYVPPTGEKNISLHIQLDEIDLPHVYRLTSPGSINNPGTDQQKKFRYGTVNERGGIEFPGEWTSPQRDLKNQAFHYALFTHERFGHIGDSGYAEFPGNDVMITLGSWDGSVGSPDTQAGTLLHEIGHNLGIDHGGEDEVNCKPNYISVMSFTRQTSDLVDRDVKLSIRKINDLNQTAIGPQVIGKYPKEPEVVYSNNTVGYIFNTTASNTAHDFGTPNQLNHFPEVDCPLDSSLPVLVSYRDSLSFDFLALSHANWKDGRSVPTPQGVSGNYGMGSTITQIQMVGDATASLVFVDHATASVSAPQGTSVPGCEETNECFVPYEVTVDAGGVVTWSNDDSAAHTVTGGTPGGGPSGVFDSSLFMAGTTFSHTFEEEGEFSYFCMVHPWMQGIVTVQEAGEEGQGENAGNNGPKSIPADVCVNRGSEYKGIKPKPAIDRICVSDELNISDSIELRKAKTKMLENAVLSIPDDHFVDPSQASSNKKDYVIQLEIVRGHIDQLNMLSAIEETKTFQSWFDGESEKNYIENNVTRAKIYNHTAEVIEAQLTVVPEFETVAIIVLSISIISVIALTSKSKLSFTRINQ